MDKRCEQALAALVQELTATPDVTGLLLFGSVQRGDAGPNADLDVYVATAGEWYWRARREYAGVPAELFFNPEPKLRQRIESGDATAVQAFATGQVLWDRTGALGELAALARRRLADGPRELGPEERLMWRFRLTDAAEDLADVAGTDPIAAQLAHAQLLIWCAEAYFALNRRWPDKLRRLPADWAAHEPELARLLAAGPAGAQAMVDLLLAPHGGRVTVFEGEKRRAK